MDRTGTISGVSARFYEIGEPYAGGFYERPEKGRSYRYARAWRRFQELCLVDKEAACLYTIRREPAKAHSALEFAYGKFRAEYTRRGSAVCSVLPASGIISMILLQYSMKICAIP
jgi:hypothetical protein